MSLGLLGSLHCVGMCGPIALTLGLNRPLSPGFVVGRVVYNLGRALSYSVMGATAGVIGYGVTAAGYQQVLSIAAGGLMLLILVAALLGTHLGAGPLRVVANAVRRTLGPLLRRAESPGSLFLIGIVNGWLPCGLVYVALAASLSMGTPLKAAFFMFLFGLGTLPLMLAMSLSGSRIGGLLRPNYLYWVGIIVAGLMVVRGLNLGVPYLSPKIERTQMAQKDPGVTPQQPGAVDVKASCCKKPE